MEGYRDKLMAAGFQLDRVLTAGHYDRQRGFQLMSEYLQATPESERVEALFCENDVLALGRSKRSGKRRRRLRWPW